MSDDFDLLETNSQEKAEKVDVNWGKAIDQMKSKLSQENNPEAMTKKQIKETFQARTTFCLAYRLA